MTLDSALFFTFLLVFVRASAMLITSPVFSAQNTPLTIRIFTTLAIAAALTTVVRPNISQPPGDMYSFAFAIAHELVAGALIGVFFSVVLHAAEMAGALIDLQMGLGLSQALNPITGVPVTLMSQFKMFLCMVVFLTVNAHHFVILAFLRSYDTMPSPTMASLPHIQVTFIALMGQMFLIALQIAAPVMAVSIVVDAALGVINKAVPQMPAFLVGLPAKIVMGLLAVSVALPAMVSSVQFGVEQATNSVAHVFAAGGRAR